MKRAGMLAAAVLFLFLTGCGTMMLDPFRAAQPPRVEKRAIRGPALIEQLLPQRLSDRSGWAEDIDAAMSALGVEPNAANACAVIAIIEQESSFRVDPAIPGLPEMARKELDKRRERAGVPKLVAESALKLSSSDGRTY